MSIWRDGASPRAFAEGARDSAPRSPPNEIRTAGRGWVRLTTRVSSRAGGGRARQAPACAGPGIRAATSSAGLQDASDFDSRPSAGGICSLRRERAGLLCELLSTRAGRACSGSRATRRVGFARHGSTDGVASPAAPRRPSRTASLTDGFVFAQGGRVFTTGRFGRRDSPSQKALVP